MLTKFEGTWLFGQQPDPKKPKPDKPKRPNPKRKRESPGKPAKPDVGRPVKKPTKSWQTAWVELKEPAVRSPLCALQIKI